MHKLIFALRSSRNAKPARLFAPALAALRRLAALAAMLALGACGGSGSGGDDAPSYIIAGTISGLDAAGLVLQNNGGDNLTVAANASSFQFATRIAAGGAYNVTVASQPAGLSCTVSRGSGSNVSAVVTDIGITCSAIAYKVSGTITGLTLNGLVLRNNGADDLAIAANATTFQFATPVAQGGGYSVVPFAQPAGLTCSVSNGSGTNVRADVGNVGITCSTTHLAVGGTVSGLTGSGLVLRNNGGDDLAIAANASAFEFATPVAYGGSYAVSILAQPAGQTCSLAHAAGTATTSVTDVALTCANIPTYTLTPGSGGNGTIAPSSAVVVNSGASQGFVATPDAGYGVDQWLLDGSPVQNGGGVYTLTNIAANHTVTVTFAQATLSLSASSLALSVNGGGALAGTPRAITLTNTGSLAAQNVAISYPTWPNGTTTSTLCGSTLAAGQSCTITITPGNSATSDCETGIAPIPGSIGVAADNASSSHADVVVLTYGCIYQGGYVFDIDDTTAATGSIGGKIAALADNTSGTAWNNVGFVATNASSITDGATNTAAITSALGAGSYAAQLCTNYEIDASGNTPCLPGTCYSSWYLPAICELGYDAQSQGSGCGTLASPTQQNIQSNLVDSGPLGSFTGAYWSSTESSGSPANDAWLQVFFSPGASSANTLNNKSLAIGVRCARVFAP